jgi:hypothetical protein
LKEADKVIFLSQSYRDKTIEKYSKNLKEEIIIKGPSIIPNGIDNFWFNNKIIEKKTENNNLKLFM